MSLNVKPKANCRFDLVSLGEIMLRLDPGDGNTYRGNYVRFAPQTTINRMFYLGAEIDIGSFDGSQPSATDTAARGGSSGTSTAGPIAQHAANSADASTAGVRVRRPGAGLEPSTPLLRSLTGGRL